MYAALQLLVGLAAGYASGQYKKAGNLQMSAAVPGSLLLLQLLDHLNVAPMPWNHHSGAGGGGGGGGGGFGPQWRPPNDPYRHQGPPRASPLEGLFDFLFKNLVVAVGVVLGYQLAINTTRTPHIFLT